MMIRSRVVTMMTVAVLGIAAAPISWAQTGQPPAAQPALSYSDDELKSFVVAALEVQRINSVYLPKLQAAATPEEQQQVRAAASEEMVQAVEKNGLSVDKYKEILDQAQTNPAVAGRVKEHIKNVK